MVVLNTNYSYTPFANIGSSSTNLHNYGSGSSLFSNVQNFYPDMAHYDVLHQSQSFKDPYATNSNINGSNSIYDNANYDAQYDSIMNGVNSNGFPLSGNFDMAKQAHRTGGLYQANDPSMYGKYYNNGINIGATGTVYGGGQGMEADWLKQLGYDPIMGSEIGPTGMFNAPYSPPPPSPGQYDYSTQGPRYLNPLNQTGAPSGTFGANQFASLIGLAPSFGGYAAGNVYGNQNAPMNWSNYFGYAPPPAPTPASTQKSNTTVLNNAAAPSTQALMAPTQTQSAPAFDQSQFQTQTNSMLGQLISSMQEALSQNITNQSNQQFSTLQDQINAAILRQSLNSDYKANTPAPLEPGVASDPNKRPAVGANRYLTEIT